MRKNHWRPYALLVIKRLHITHLQPWGDAMDPPYTRHSKQHDKKCKFTTGCQISALSIMYKFEVKSTTIILLLLMIRYMSWSAGLRTGRIFSKAWAKRNTNLKKSNKYFIHTWYFPIWREMLQYFLCEDIQW